MGDLETAMTPNQKYAATKKAWYVEKRKNKPEGVCAEFPNCRRPVGNGVKRCAYHIEMGKKTKETARSKPKKEGQCRASDCRSPARPGKSRCERCAKRESDHFKKPKTKVRMVASRQTLKLEAFAAYGGKCACCGESGIPFLSIDHVDRYGGTGPRAGDHLYQWLKTEGYPAGFRVLCMSCNTALGFHGYCPHSGLRQARKVDGKPSSSDREYQRQYRIRLRLKVFEGYGGAKCKCCGETAYECLSIDHIENDGAAHRKALTGRNRNRGVDVLRRLAEDGFPPGFQVLCMNCNFAKKFNGVCPHKGVSP